MIRRFYVIGIVVAVTISLGMFIQFKYFEKSINTETQRNIILERNVIAGDIGSKLGNRGQVMTDAELYLASETDTEHILDFLKNLSAGNTSFSSIYFGTPDNVIVNSSGFVPPESFDLRTRPWYIKAVAADRLIFTEPFMNATKDQLIITVACPVYNENHEFLGVVAGDITMQGIVELVMNQKSSDTKYSFLIDGKGNILAHPDYDYAATATLVNIQDISENLSVSMLQHSTGTTPITLDGTEGYLAYQPIEGTDWTLGSFIQTDDYLQKDQQALLIFLLTLISSGFIFTVLLFQQKKHIIGPILELDTDIQAISIENDMSYRLKAEDDVFEGLRKSVNLVLKKTQDYFNELETSKLALVTSEERNRAIVNALPDILFILDTNGVFLDFHVNNESLLLLKKEDFMGKAIENVFPAEIATKGNMAISQALETGRLQMFEYDLDLPDGRHCFEVRMVKSSHHEVVAIVRDITEEKNNQIYIEYLSYHDQLTGLYNRRFYEEELKRLDIEKNLPLTIALLDVNGLKLTNDAFGHLAGDTLLKNVADLLTNACRSSDIISRIGGDEFTILFPQTDSDETAKIIKCIYEAAASLNPNTIVLSVSIGWETKTAMEQSINDLFIKAEDHMYRKKLVESQSMRHQTLQLIMNTLHEKNEREKRHSDQVSIISKQIGEAMNLDYETIKELETAGLLHDIGKISISEAILNKPGPLLPSEYDEVKKHPEIGYQILKSVDAYSSLAEYVLAHHERMDGQGYPLGLIGDKIPLIARIIAVADAYEAMSSDRTYRKALTPTEIIKELRDNSFTQFDPEIVEIFIHKVLNKLATATGTMVEAI